MSTVYMTIENISDNFDGGEEVYSVIDSMNCYRVEVVDGCEYEAYDQDHNVVEDEDLAGTLIDQVINFQKGE